MNRKHWFSSVVNKCVYAFIISLCLCVNSVAARNTDSRIELSHSTVSNTFESVTAIGLYSSLSKKRNTGAYVGIQIVAFEFSSTENSDAIFRFMIGGQYPGRISPFIEIGTDVIGIIILADDQEKNCQDDSQCRVDVFAKVGIKLQISKELSIGIFHESLSFGDFHEKLNGDHSYTGGSLSIHF